MTLPDIDPAWVTAATGGASALLIKAAHWAWAIHRGMRRDLERLKQRHHSLREAHQELIIRYRALSGQLDEDTFKPSMEALPEETDDDTA